MNLKSEKGSITVFVVASCMLFIIVALGISNFIQNKSNNEEEQYREIKKSYEKDIGNEDVIYDRLNNNIHIENVDFEAKKTYIIPTGENDVTISQKFTIVNNSLSINNIRYRWYYKENLNDENWNELGDNWTSLPKLDKTYIIKKESADEGIYALKVQINDETYNNTYTHIIKVEVASITVNQNLTTITFGDELKYNYRVGIGETLELAKSNASTVAVENNTFNYGTMTISNFLYAEATDSYGNKVYGSVNLSNE